MIKKTLVSMAAVMAIAVAVGAMYLTLGSGGSAEAGRWSPRVPDSCVAIVSLDTEGYRWFNRGCER